MAITLNGIDLQKVETLTIDKRGNILQLPMPTRDSNESETFDMLGVTKVVTVIGVLSANIITAITAFEGLCGGDQQNSVDFVAAGYIPATLKVKVNQVRTSWDIPGFVARYELQLLEGV